MDKSIIVKNLPADFYVPDLCDKFKCFGKILSATVNFDESQNSSGQAYIAFEDNFSAVEAAKRVDGCIINGRPIKVLLSIENEHYKKVFVKNFNPEWDAGDLFEAFEEIGSIEDAHVSENNGKSNGYGFLVFKLHSTAKRAIESMNGKVVDGHELLVERFRNKTERESLAENSLERVGELLRKSVQYDNLHVKNLPADMTEREFWKLFKKHGEISSIKIMTNEKGASKGFGFVSFTKKEYAAKALERMNGFSVRGKMLQINFKEDGHIRKKYNTLKNMSREVQLNQYKQRSQSVPKLIPYSLTHKISRRSP